MEYDMKPITDLMDSAIERLTALMNPNIKLADDIEDLPDGNDIEIIGDLNNLPKF